MVTDHSGSFRLTGNLDVSGQTNPESVSAVVIEADDVTLDLNGFTISGPTSCFGTPVTSCSLTGGGDGIQGVSSDHSTIMNGTIRSMGRFGITLGDWGNVRSVHLHDNGDNALRCGEDCQITDNTVEKNGNLGILVSGGLIRNNNVGNNKDDGIAAGTGVGVNIVGNTVNNNGGRGITFSEQAPPDPSARLVTGNSIFSNAELGIDAGAASTVGFGGNVINANNGGNGNAQVSAGMNSLAPNICGNDLTCP